MHTNLQPCTVECLRSVETKALFSYLESGTLGSAIGTTEQASDSPASESDTNKEMAQPSGNAQLSRFSELKDAPPSVNRLPLELLHLIFYLTADSRHPYRHVVTLTLVCKHWRSAVENCPRLWATIDMQYSAPIVADLLSKSKGAPLHYRHWSSLAEVTYTLEEETEVFRSVCCHIFRWRSAEISLRPHLPAGLLTESPAPFLRSLHLIGYNGLAIPLDLYKSQAASLRSLHLVDVYIPWESPLLSNLEDLQIRAIRNTISPTSQQLLDCIRTSPKIENIAFQSLTLAASPSYSPIHTQPPLLLSCLGRLGIEGMPNDFVNSFMAAFDIPEEASVVVGVRPTTTIAQLEGSLAFGIRKLLTWMLTPYEEYQVALVDNDLEFRFRTDPTYFDCPGRHQLQLNRFEPRDFLLVSAAECINPSIGGRIKELLLGNYDADLQHVISVLACLPNLETLQLEGFEAPQMDRVLQFLGNPQAGGWPCPMLLNFTISFCGWRSHTILMTMLLSRYDNHSSHGYHQGGEVEKPSTLDKLKLEHCVRRVPNNIQQDIRAIGGIHNAVFIDNGMILVSSDSSS